MNNIEETLWGYIDGNCTPEEQIVIARLIAEDETYGLKYQEILKLDNGFAAMELDEPPMAFTYNVMEAIRTQQAMVPLKAAINRKIIMVITVFFAVTLSALLILVFMNINWSVQSHLSGNNLHIKMPDFKCNNTKIAIDGFVFFDVVLGLYLLDAWLRGQFIAKHN